MDFLTSKYEYVVTVNLKARMRDKRGFGTLARRVGLTHNSPNMANNAARLLSDHKDVISATVDIVFTGRLSVFGHGMPTL